MGCSAAIARRRKVSTPGAIPIEIAPTCQPLAEAREEANERRASRKFRFYEALDWVLVFEAE